MAAEIAAGKNPYHDWLQVALGSQWKQALAHADSQAPLASLPQTLHQRAKAHGVPWVTGVPREGGLMAGGEDQPSIQVIHDTVVAGYNTLIAPLSAAPSDQPTPLPRLAKTFPTPEAAARWVVQVVGEQIISTTAKGIKAIQPGRGVLGFLHTAAEDLAQQLNHLLAHTGHPQAAYDAISPPGVGLNYEVLNQLRQQPVALQPLLIHTLRPRNCPGTGVGYQQAGLGVNAGGPSGAGDCHESCRTTTHTNGD